MDPERHSHMDHKYWVYIVSSRSGTLYIGVTNSIERRMREHKSGEFEGFASEYDCNRLVYGESYDDVYKAIGREKQLKGWRRSKKIALIEAMNPRWEDLAEKWGAEMAFAGQSIKDR
jgi:putative endonuclease